MAIVCRECKYILTQAEILGYVSSASAEKVFDFTKDVVLACLSKHSYVEDFAFGIANNQKIDCAVCFKYVGWIKIADGQESGESVIE